MFNLPSKIEARTGSESWTCEVVAHVVIPSKPRDVFTLLTHPENAAIFQNIDRCVYRRVLDDKDGLTTIEVENESGWSFLNFRGTLRTMLLVNEDHKNRTMNFELMPNTRSGPLIKMHGEWTVMPLHHHLAEPVAGLDGIEAMFEEYSVVRFQQKLLARLPRFSHSAFASFSKKAVRRTIHDLVEEIDNIKNNKPTLRPYAEVCKLEIERKGSVMEPGVEEEMAKGGKESTVANNKSHHQDPMSVLEDFESDEKTDGSNSSGSNMTQSSQSCPLSHKLLSLELVDDDDDEGGSGGGRGSFKLGVVWGEREEKSLYNKTRDVCWQVIWGLIPSDGGFGVAAFI